MVPTNINIFRLIARRKTWKNVKCKIFEDNVSLNEPFTPAGSSF